MREISVIFGKEWHNFTGSEKGVFAIYGILIFVWSFLPLYNDLGSFAFSGVVWWLFFSVIVSGNFANTVFVSERMSGGMEILLTCGFSRDSVLFGKIVFVMIMSGAIGGLCFGLSFVWIALSGQLYPVVAKAVFLGAMLYCAGTFMNAAAGAWMSIRLSSPRLIPFVNILLIAIVCGVYYAVYYAVPVTVWLLVALLFAAGIVFLALAKKDFHGEKIIAPLDI
jgi:ABC-type transport system involved in multi-copper enzyme maturation permease subunit